MRCTPWTNRNGRILPASRIGGRSLGLGADSRGEFSRKRELAGRLTALLASAGNEVANRLINHRGLPRRRPGADSLPAEPYSDTDSGGQAGNPGFPGLGCVPRARAAKIGP